VLILTIIGACSGTGADSTATIETVTTVLESTSTTEPDGTFDCLTSVSSISIPEYPTDLVGEPTPRAAAERLAEFDIRTGPLVEIEPLRFAIVEQGRETAIIDVLETPAGGYLAGPIRGCA
jgi:hypothetical protein